MNIAELLFDRAREYPGQTALLDGETVLSYARLEELSRTVSEELVRILPGCVPGGVQARIGLFWPNAWEYVVLALGILRAGACLIPVAEELTPAERESQTRLTAVHLLISPASSQSGVEGRVEAQNQGWVEGSIRWQWTVLQSRPEFPEERFLAVRPAFIRFSSGTTGDSKGVVLGHAALLERVRSANRRLGIGREDRVLWTLPMAHHFAVSIVLYLLEGATTVLEKAHLAADILETARRTGATVIYGSPFHHALLAAEPSGLPWPTLRLAVSTASSLREETARAFHARFGVPLCQGLGIIEAGLPLLNDAPLEKPLSVGKPDDFQLRVVREDGTLCGPGEAGELQVRGPGLFDAYLLPWTERAELDGWFATGDLVEQDSAGYIFIRGRRKSVINFGGMKFFPEEVEAVLCRHPQVAECRVSGEPHEQWNQIPVAEVVPADPLSKPGAAALSKHCRAWIASYKVPVRFRFVDELPRTASGKIKR
jgi:long-chain acyl-CoA synthetase